MPSLMKRRQLTKLLDRFIHAFYKYCFHNTYQISTCQRLYINSFEEGILLYCVYCLPYVVHRDVLIQICFRSAENEFIKKCLKYIGKVLLEAFFYALFFALWSDIFNEYSFRSRLKFLNNGYKICILSIINY